MAGAASCFVESKRWMDDETKLFIQLRAKHRHLFPGKRGTAIEGYKKLSKMMNNLGYGATPLQVKKKWENLCSKYKDLKKTAVQKSKDNRPNHHSDSEDDTTTWPFYDAMEDYYNNRPATTVEKRKHNISASVAAANSDKKPLTTATSNFSTTGGKNMKLTLITFVPPNGRPQSTSVPLLAAPKPSATTSSSILSDPLSQESLDINISSPVHLSAPTSPNNSADPSQFLKISLSPNESLQPKKKRRKLCTNKKDYSHTALLASSSDESTTSCTSQRRRSSSTKFLLKKVLEVMERNEERYERLATATEQIATASKILVSKLVNKEEKDERNVIINSWINTLVQDGEEEHKQEESGTSIQSLEERASMVSTDLKKESDEENFTNSQEVILNSFPEEGGEDIVIKTEPEEVLNNSTPL